MFGDVLGVGVGFTFAGSTLGRGTTTGAVNCDPANSIRMSASLYFAVINTGTCHSSSLKYAWTLSRGLRLISIFATNASNDPTFVLMSCFPVTLIAAAYSSFSFLTLMRYANPGAKGIARPR